MWFPTLLACLTLTGPQDTVPESSPTASQAQELGNITWQRRLEPALQACAKDHKPVFLLFQEVPG